MFEMRASVLAPGQRLEPEQLQVRQEEISSVRQQAVADEFLVAGLNLGYVSGSRAGGVSGMPPYHRVDMVVECEAASRGRQRDPEVGILALVERLGKSGSADGAEANSKYS